MSEFRLFKIAYEDIFQQKLPESFNLDNLNMEILNLSQKILNQDFSEIQKNENKENQTEILLNDEYLVDLNNKYQIIFQISSLLKSFLDFFTTNSQNVQKSYKRTLAIIKKIKKIDVKEELEQINISQHINQWIEKLNEELEKERQESQNQLENELYNVIDCAKCHKRPAIFYSLPCCHANYCKHCMQELIDNNVDPSSILCLRCHSKIDSIRPIKLNKIV